MIVRFDFRRFHEGDSQAAGELLAVIERLVETDIAYLRAHPETPGLYESGVVARTYAVRDCHHFSDIGAALRDGHASALSLAAWRCAEYRVRDVAACVLLKNKAMPDGGARLSFHVQRFHLRPLLDDQGPLEEPFSKCKSTESDEIRKECCDSR